MQQPGPAVLGRQGLGRPAAPGRKGLPPGQIPVPAGAHRHRPQLRRSDRLPRRARRRTGRAPDRRLGRRLDHAAARCACAIRPPIRATRPRPSRCSKPSPNTASTPASAAPAATRKRPAPRNASFPSATNSASGTRRTSAPNCGTCITPASTRAKTCACSRSRTGPSSTCGSTSPANKLALPSIYFAHQRQVIARNGLLVPLTHLTPARDGETVENRTRALPHRRRHHLHLPGGVAAPTRWPTIIAETAITDITERGATRMDDQTSEASMEKRKKEGYF